MRRPCIMTQRMQSVHYSGKGIDLLNCNCFCIYNFSHKLRFSALIRLYITVPARAISAHSTAGRWWGAGASAVRSHRVLEQRMWWSALLRFPNPCSWFWSPCAQHSFNTTYVHLFWKSLIFLCVFFHITYISCYSKVLEQVMLCRNKQSYCYKPLKVFHIKWWSLVSPSDRYSI